MMKHIKEISFAARSGLRARINLRNAALHITGNADKTPELKVEIGTVSSLKEGQDITDFFDLKYDEENNQLELEQTDTDIPSLLKNLKFDLTLPVQSEITSKSANGAIKIENIQGDQDYTNANGALKIVSCVGRIETHSKNGAAKIIDHQGDIILDLKNGAVAMMDCEGSIQLQNTNGAVKLNHCSGSLQLENTNGSIKVLSAAFNEARIKTQNSGIYYEFDEIDAGNFTFSSNLGRISLIIPDNLEYDITAKNNKGRINIGLDKSYEQRGDGQKEFSLTNGSGSVKILAENNMGRINILDELHRQEKPESKISRKIEVLLKDKIIPTLENLTSENAPKVEKKIKQAGEKLSKIKIDIPDIETKIKDIINQVSDTVRTTTEEKAEDIEKIKESAINSVNKTWENLSSSWKEKQQQNHEDKEQKVNERSRLKILELLETGKITADEAEKLLKALGMEKE